MSPVIHLTTALGSSLIIILIFINYLGKFNADDFQRKLFLTLLGAALAAIITELIGHSIEGKSGSGVRSFLYVINSLFLIAQNTTFYLSAAFIDYFARKNAQRTKKFIIAIVIFLALYSVSVIINAFYGFYFTISDNQYTPGTHYNLRLIISYSSILLIMINLLISVKQFERSQVYLIILFFLITGAGAAIDIVIEDSSLLWPCFTAAGLYLYFFVIQSDLKIDSLTRIGNRASFNDYVEKISRQSSRQEYAIVMIDMDKFKEINDTLGHLEGDNALRDVSSIIKGCIRASDFAARYGGDEFVLATKADSDIQRLMDRIMSAINLQNERQERPYQLYISYGYDIYRAGDSIPEFLTKIDEMMYKQKAERKAKGIPSSITSKLPNYRGPAVSNV